jgi:hypothetical protein
MTRSEIDDIFASKLKKGSSPRPAVSSSTVGSTPPKKKKKDKKRKRQQPDEHVDPDEKPPKRPVPETIVDPSSSLLSVPAPNVKLNKKLSSIVKSKNKQKDREVLEQFKDSRGTGPSGHSLCY